MEAWYTIGLISCLLAIIAFRKDGRSKRKGELYIVLIGPWFGPIVTFLLFAAYLKREWEKQRENT